MSAFCVLHSYPTEGLMKRKPTPAATNDSGRLMGRVVSVRPTAPGVIVVPGHQPDRFVFSSSDVDKVEIGCLVTFAPLPPREAKHQCGQAVDVVVALPAREVPRYRRGDSSIVDDCKNGPCRKSYRTPSWIKKPDWTRKRSPIRKPNWTKRPNWTSKPQWIKNLP